MILVIDNYDSFTYNLVQYLGQCGADVKVVRNDKITVPQVKALAPAGIMLSPGPCTPKESGVCLDILSSSLNGHLNVPIFGVCLGLQAFAEVAGSVVHRAKRPMHGKTSMVEHDGNGLFKGLPNPLKVVRYHSLVVKKDLVPTGFVVTSTSMDDHEIMGLRHESLLIEGVQFHPESVMTDSGMAIVRNFVDLVNQGSEPQLAR